MATPKNTVARAIMASKEHMLTNVSMRNLRPVWILEHNCDTGTAGKPVLPRGRTFPCAHHLPGPPKQRQLGQQAEQARIVMRVTTGGTSIYWIILVLGILGSSPATQPPCFQGRSRWQSKAVCAGGTWGKVENLGKTRMQRENMTTTVNKAWPCLTSTVCQTLRSCPPVNVGNVRIVCLG